MEKTKGLTFKLDSLDWHGGVSDKFSGTPLGTLAKPLTIEQIYKITLTNISYNVIYIIPVQTETQIKFWLKIPERVKEKIKAYSHEIFPFEGKEITERFLFAYSVDNAKGNYIGFVFESILVSSKVPLYVFFEAKISNKDTKKFLKEYVENINNLDIDNIEPEKENINIFQKVLNMFNTFKR